MTKNEYQGRPAHPLEVWAGVECTFNRVGDRFFDQMTWNGHATRLEDLDRFASLGIRAIRYPVLWERTAPEGVAAADWRWTDERLNRLRELNLRPIAGLVHHGSGPLDTNLMDPEFPRKLAGYARAVAERYPWLDAYTPINEPLTTARFSGLYGHWYPHLRSPQAFMRILINEVRGTQQAMRAIRTVNPTAWLVQTDDLGKTYASQALAYQAQHENERRWLAYDLLIGRVDRRHPLYDYLTWLGISDQELAEIQQDAVQPDIMGINYYVTSERYLDERLDLYPPFMHGGNGRQPYVDVEAVRVVQDAPAGHLGILQEAWDRYHLPLALTEVHLGGHHEQQLRWWMEAWDAANALRQAGVDFRAITAWALLGSFYWNTLVTNEDGDYESGVFDVRGPTPRPTILARAIEYTAKRGGFEHPILAAPGWWRSAHRLLYHPVNLQESPTAAARTPLVTAQRTSRPLLITGANGTLGQAFQRICTVRDIPFQAVLRHELDITNERQVAEVLDEVRPWAVINTAGYVRVDEAERDPETCRRANALGPAVLAEHCAANGLAFLSFSSDLVFNGAQSVPYLESDQPDPLNIYGLSKAEGEHRILEVNPRALIVRSSAFFGPWDTANFLMQIIRAIQAQEAFVAPEDAVVSPTYVPDLVHACLDLLIDGESGIWHLTNQGALSWSDFACLFTHVARLDDARVMSAPLEQLSLPAPRPHYSALGSERGLLLPDLDQALACFVQEVL